MPTGQVGTNGPGAVPDLRELTLHPIQYKFRVTTGKKFRYDP